jgi:hypothetical protein
MLRLLLAALVALPLAACQSDGLEDGGWTLRSNQNKAKTDDPIEALKRY